MVAFVSSAGNIANLENIRTSNLDVVNKNGNYPGTQPVIVWLSYNVHGNETRSSEAAMEALYELANPAKKRTQPWFKNTVVVIDPCLNPDGRERYINYYNSVIIII